MNQENYIKEMRIAGLRAEQRLLEHGLPLLRAIEAASSVGRASSTPDEVAEVKCKLIDETRSVQVYLLAHTLVPFPSRHGVTGKVRVAEEVPAESSSPSLDDLINDMVADNGSAQ